MVRGLYTAYTGMLAQQQKMDTISNNLANANTIGFKKDGVVFKSFKDVYMIKINDPEQMGNKRIGKASLGVKAGEIYTDFEQGALIQTDNPINMALQGKGMFVVGSIDRQGNLIEKYTRDGSFMLNPNGQIVSTDGYFLLGNNGPIIVNNSNIRISEEGNIYDENDLIDKVKTIDFENLQSLKKIGGNIYEATEQTIIKDFEGQVVQGFTEASNVNSIDEMINMINVMRTYETNQKVISTYDTTLEKSVNEVGRL